MSDLRTRIAAAACDATSAGKLFPWDTLSEPQKDAWRRMADAVIAELGLYQDKCPCSQPGPNCAHRYITAWKTGWKADDE